MESFGYRARWFETLAHSGDRTFKQGWKFWIYDDSNVAWELRRVLLPVLHSSRTCVARALRCDFQGWTGWVLANRHGTHIYESVRAHEARGQDAADMSRYIRHEWSCTTAALLDLLCFLAVFRRAHDDREKGFLMLESLLRHMLEPDAAARLFPCTLDAHDHALCTIRARFGVCSHCWDFF